MGWEERYDRLAALLKPQATSDDPTCDRVGLALDRFTDAQKTQLRPSSRTDDVEALRFTNKDLVVLGTLLKGQFGTVHIVQCKLDGKVYVRKSVTKSSAIRNRQQCSVHFERELLVKAYEVNSAWVPTLLCTYQADSNVNFVMEYAVGGSLEDVLNSATLGRLEEGDLLWWAPQAVSAIAWCHSIGFAHRDVKPQNFVITSTFHLKLIDFGSAAPLLPPNDGVHLIAQKYCLMPCGTLDYIAPEILSMYEQALVAQDLSDVGGFDNDEQGAYGKEVDWWSLGAMLFELATGEAPFFAETVDQTSDKIMHHKRYPPKFDKAGDISNNCKHLIKSFLSSHERRLGRRGTEEVQAHPWFQSVNWKVLNLQQSPPDLVIPDANPAAQNATPLLNLPPDEEQSGSSDSGAGGFDFSAFFQSSVGMSTRLISPMTPAPPPKEQHVSIFQGFTWGPAKDAFINRAPSPLPNGTPKAGPKRRTSLQPPPTPYNGGLLKRPGLTHAHHLSEPNALLSLATPIRPGLAHSATTIPRTGGTARKVRHVSDREAFRQMIMHVGMSARKKVLESGKKPRNATPVQFAPLPAFDPNARHAVDDIATVKKPKKTPPLPLTIVTKPAALHQSTTSESTAPPSPSPRPNSAMSRRSATPGLTTGTKSMTTLTPDGSALRTARSKDWTGHFPSMTPKSVNNTRSGYGSRLLSPTPPLVIPPPAPSSERIPNQNSRLEAVQRRLDRLLQDLSHAEQLAARAIQELQ